MTEPTDLAEQLAAAEERAEQASGIVLAAERRAEHAEAERDAAIARAEQAEDALAALHQGEEPHLDQLTVPTPAQWIWRWNRATSAERLDAAARAISQGNTAYQCVMENHPVRLADLQQRYADEHATAVARAAETDRVRRQLAAAEARIAAARTIATEHAAGEQYWDANAVSIGEEILAALDGPADTPPRPGCCICGSLTHGGRKFYENYRGQLFCWPCADGRQPTCPLGEKCDGVDCPRRADHGPRPDAEPERPAGWCPTCEGQPQKATS
jgi:DNA repair exonuclease SbcCD ATPase subunit